MIPPNNGQPPNGNVQAVQLQLLDPNSNWGIASIGIEPVINDGKLTLHLVIFAARATPIVTQQPRMYKLQLPAMGGAPTEALIKALDDIEARDTDKPATPLVLVS